MIYTMKTNQNKTEMTRRRFIGASAVATFGFQVVPSRVFGANSRLAVAGIGAGGKGRADVSGAAAAGADIVALCDVDESRAAGMFKAHPKAKRFSDFRVMLEKMGKSIDACTISTPDHTHAAATSMAMKMGKHCYTQKPLTHDVYEARHLPAWPSAPVSPRRWETRRTPASRSAVRSSWFAPGLLAT